jgi:hypothetical protein
MLKINGDILLEEWRGAEFIPCDQHAPGTRSYLSNRSVGVSVESLELYSLYLRGPLDTDGRGGRRR